MSYNKLLLEIVKKSPEAVAFIKGNEEHQDLEGVVEFYEFEMGGTIVYAEVYGLGSSMMPLNNQIMTKFYGMHIHDMGDCSLPFDKTGEHYNPYNTEHPMHAGDLPPLLGNNGFAWTMFYDGRFTPDEIIGKSVVIHSDRDDFTTQPSGNSGMKIGCGVIMEN